jgi:hypothetical protein
MYIAIGIHHPKSGKDQVVLDAMVKFGNAQKGHKGLVTVFAWKDEATGALIGTSIWDTKSDYEAARPEMSKALEDVDFEQLDNSIEAYRGSPVVWV